MAHAFCGEKGSRDARGRLIAGRRAWCSLCAAPAMASAPLKLTCLRFSHLRSKVFNASCHGGARAKATLQDVLKPRPADPNLLRYIRMTKPASPHFVAKGLLGTNRYDATAPAENMRDWHGESVRPEKIALLELREEHHDAADRRRIHRARSEEGREGKTQLTSTPSPNAEMLYLLQPWLEKNSSFK